MQRITEKDLEAVVKRINVITGMPLTPYTRDEHGKCTANIGNYHLSHAYGGVTLHRMHSQGGGVSTPLQCGYVPKRELYQLMHAFLRGMETSDK